MSTPEIDRNPHWLTIPFVQMGDDNSLSTERLDKIETELKGKLARASEASQEALEAGNEAGALLHEAQSICGQSGRNFRRWLQRQNLNRDRARVLVQLHINWTEVKQRMQQQLIMPFAEARQLTAGKTNDAIANAVWDDTEPYADDDYQTTSEDFTYPDEDDDEGPSPGAEAISGIYRCIIPSRLETRDDWRTFMVRFVGMSFLVGAVPDNVSMRDACKALGVSHATISKYVRQLADETGIRSPIMKKESARQVYSRVQKEGHWRHRE